ncbi:uncharacterized protein LAESUDRAFT_717488 [Laetiporus sulphureus 93-53]|uniref:Uncharacterized protein n=1 Tax=Laetiporus sulphureus 93-53 TaxID=1314785 RepID=A0A165BQS6_9APHY|nr:uncharacterized protein LAESUDRAFT_717488 [Laetiporus sulphureus 93-53]KZT01484.1 hypothetical protein LAESUDRAFT_717488 [Laetiporus sulphureus 93-53]
MTIGELHTFLYWVVWKHHSSSASDGVIDTFLMLAVYLEDQAALDIWQSPDKSLLDLLSIDSVHVKESESSQDGFNFTVRFSKPGSQAHLNVMRCITLELHKDVFGSCSLSRCALTLSRNMNKMTIDNWKDGWWIVKVSLLGTSPYVPFELQLVFLHGPSESSLPVTLSPLRGLWLGL